MTAAAPFLPELMGPVALVVSQLPGARRSGRGYVARCPAHEDREPSLSVTEGRDGRALLNCHAGCTVEAIVGALGLTMSQLYPESTRRSGNGTTPPRESYDADARPKMTASYDYTDESGALLYQAIRLEYPDGRKTFRQRRPDGRGGWIYSLGDVTRLVPYRLPELHRAMAEGRPVLIVEGEKDVETLTEAGYVATTNPMGAGKWRDEFSTIFRGAMVIVLPDNDDTGKQHAQAVAASIHGAGAKWVRVCELPGLPPKGDVTDWLEAGHDLDQLQEAIGAAPLWHPDPANRTRWRLDELWENEAIMRPPPAVVPRLAWSARSTLVAAREKAGKSTLTGYVTAQVTTGGHFLGEPCQQGDVLLIGLEEFIGDAARRLKQFRADATRVHIVDRFSGDPGDRPRELRAHIEAVRPVLVIIDSLAAYSHGQIHDDNNATQMASVVQPLTDAAHDLGTALIIIHHARKSDGRARGSTAIMAGTDVVCEMLTPNEDTDPTLREMRSAGRVPVPRVYQFRFDGSDYSLADGLGAVTVPIEQRIREVVRNRPGLSLNDLADAVGGRRDLATKAVHAMLVTRELVNHGSSSQRMRLALPVSDSLGADL